MEIFGGISWSCSITFLNSLELSSINWPSHLYVKKLSVLDRISITVINTDQKLCERKECTLPSLPHDFLRH